MVYADFSLERVRLSFGLTLAQAPLFAHVAPLAAPAWLQEALARGMPLALGSEKARSEFIIAPLLLALRELNQNRIAIYSGQRLDSDPGAGLVGECDFIITATPPLPIIQSPIINIVEAKKNDIESGLGQCAAQLLGAQRFNLRDHTGITTIYGCVTTGEAWQLLRLADSTLVIDQDRYYINELERILGALQAMLDAALPAPEGDA